MTRIFRDELQDSLMMEDSDGADEDIFERCVPLVYAPIYIEAADYWKRFTTHTNKIRLEKGT